MIHDSTCNVYNDVVIGVTLQVLSAYTFILVVIDDVLELNNDRTSQSIGDCRLPEMSRV